MPDILQTTGKSLFHKYPNTNVGANPIPFWEAERAVQTAKS